MSKPDDLVPATEAYKIELGEDETHMNIVVILRTAAGVVFGRLPPRDAMDFGLKVQIAARNLEEALNNAKIV